MSALGVKRTSRAAHVWLYAALSTTCLAALSITMGVSKYWNSALPPNVAWIRALNSGPCACLAALTILPLINTTTPSGRFIEQVGLADQVRVSLPSRYAKSILRRGIFTAHSLWQAKQNDLGNHVHLPGVRIPA